jgi:hypothetical protein
VIAAQIALWLDSENVAAVAASEASGGNVFVDRLPDSPDRAYRFGHVPGPEADARLGWDDRRLQIVCRGTTDPRVAYQDAMDIFAALHGAEDVETEDGTVIAWIISQQTGPTPLGIDDKGRYRYSLNFRMEVRALTGTRE